MLSVGWVVKVGDLAGGMDAGPAGPIRTARAPEVCRALSTPTLGISSRRPIRLPEQRGRNHGTVLARFVRLLRIKNVRNPVPGV
jgi:hypothetical protein